jgi:WD40 repeat protein
VEEIARGGMGVVWRARQDGLHREVALKMILAGQLATSAQVIRFYTEARAAARLDHPGIVPIHEIGEDEGHHFYTMMFMEGRSLADALKAGPLPSPEQAARTVLAVARAIHYAHQRGVLHRDVKPSNILLDREGRPRIADFGLARLADADSDSTRSHPILGTPAYMAPEQASGRSGEVTTAADVYGLGAVLHELLTGEPPFKGATPLETLRLLLENEPTSLSSRNPGLDRDLEVICLKCLQKQPEKRYASAGDLADDLERWLAGEPILARPVSALERIISWARRKRELATAIAALFAVLVAALATTLALLWKVQRESEARATALRLEESQRLAFQSLAVLGENPGQALLLALEAAARAPALSANNALLEAMEACRERRRLLGHERVVHFGSFSRDGTRVVTASQDQTARIWSVTTGEQLLVLRGHSGGVRTAIFSPDGKAVLTAGDDPTARLWDAESGRELLRLVGHEHGLRSARFSPDGQRVLTAAQNTARLWDTGSGAVIHVFDRHQDGITAAQFSPDGARVATGGRDGTAKIWDAARGSLLATLPGHTERIIDIAFSADGRRIATASDPEAHVWDASTHAEVCVARGHAHGIYSLALTADGTLLATGSEDFTARIWDAGSGETLHVLPHEHKVVWVEISRADSLLLTASYDTTARVWDLASGQLLTTLRGHAAPLHQAAFSPDGRSVVTSCVDFTARLWSVHAAQPIVLPSRGLTGVVSADVAAGGKTLVEAYGKTRMARVLDLDSRREIARLEGHEGDVLSVRFNRDGDLIVTGAADHTARVWEARTGKGLETLSGHEGPVTSASFSPDGRRLLTVSADRTARLWDVAGGKQAAVYTAGTLIKTAAFNPASDLIALTDDAGHLRIAAPDSGRITDFATEDPVVFACFAAGGEILAACGTTRAHLFSLNDRRILGTFAHPARVDAVASSPDRRWIGTLGLDAAVRLWDAATHEERLEIKRAGKGVVRFHFPADGRSLVIIWGAGGVRDSLLAEAVIYPLDVLGAARQARFGDLTPDERDHFQVGSAEERREHRRRWTGGHIFGSQPAARR